MLTINTPAPDFNLLDQDGIPHRLSDYRGFWTLIYFYPKDDTPGCTKEACTIRDHWHEFSNHQIKVFGISADSVSKHKKFVDKYQLPFTLLSDESKAVINSYNAWGKKKFMGREYDGIFRISYLIDAAGTIAKVYPDVKPAEHAAAIIKDYQLLSR